jgi:GNAT superfamily N-acetyltransferase
MSERKQVLIRRPRAADFAAEADATATMYIESRRAMIHGLKELHTEAETRVWMRDTVFTHQAVRLADVDGVIVGFAARDGAWLTQLYVKPGWTSLSIGSKLLAAILADAKGKTPVLRLYTYARNERARKFYERHGFVAVAFGDGSGNEEGEPDVRYERSTLDLPS